MAMLRVQHISALQNVSPNTKISKSSSTKKVKFIPVTRLTLPSTVRCKYKPMYAMEETKYHRLLAGDPIALHQLRIDGIDTTMPPSPNMSLRRVPGPRVSTPVTPPLTMLQGEKLISIDEVGTTNAMSAPRTPTKIYKGSPLDKELPSKPILRSRDSPERSGFVDTLDSDILSLDTPSLDPTCSSSDEESVKSFKMASSLGSPSITGEVETGVAVVIQGETVTTISGKSDKEIGKSKLVKAIPSHAPRIDSRMIPVRGLSTAGSNGSLNRRAARCSVGPTLRKTSDCHSIIMGPSPHPPRTSSLPKTVNNSVQVSTASRLSRPTKASAAREIEAKKNMTKNGKTLFTKGYTSKVPVVPVEKASVRISKSSMFSPTSHFTANNLSYPSSANSLADSNDRSEKDTFRLSSSKSSIPTSTSATSLKKASKGLKSRFSELFGRQNTTTTEVDDKGLSFTADDVGTDLLPKSVSTISLKHTSKLINNYCNSGPEDNLVSTKVPREDKQQTTAEMVDREPSIREQHRRDRETQSFNAVAGDNITTGMIGRAIMANRSINEGRGDDEPPFPLRLGNGPEGEHYFENEAEAAAHVTDLALRETYIDTNLTARLDAAQAALTHALDNVNHLMADDESVAQINAILQALGNSIIMSRQVLIAGIELRTVTANLIDHTTLRAERARNVVMNAVEVASRHVHADITQTNSITADVGVAARVEDE